MSKRRILAVLAASLLCIQPFFGQDAGIIDFIDGCKSYSVGDWTSAIFSLKKATASDSGNTAETYYMLINAEMNTGDYANALDDCVYYLEEFKGSLYEPNIVYSKGRCYFSLAEYDKAIITLSDFCHQYDGHDMYASSLFWIGESFYACYQYDDAKVMFERIVSEFPDDSKAPASQYRIETISQRDREEKLLYLLKQTGEEYLFAKEEYEKQLKVYSSETTADTRAKLLEAQKKNMELEEKYQALELEMESLKATIANGISQPLESSSEETLFEMLKQKAVETRLLLEKRNSQKSNK